MEKVITINSVKFTPTKAGKDKYTIETNGGQFSVWDSALAEKLNKRINTSVSVEFRPAPLESNYYATITAMNDASDGTIKSEVEQGERALNGEAQPIEKVLTLGRAMGKSEIIRSIPSRDTNITAQCLTKCVAEIVKMQPDASKMADVAESVLKVYNGFLEKL